MFGYDPGDVDNISRAQATPQAGLPPPTLAETLAANPVYALLLFFFILAGCAAVYVSWRKWGHCLPRVLDTVGTGVMVVCWGSLFLTFLVVLVNGEWPDSLSFVRNRLKIGADFFGFFWVPVLISLVSAPGYALKWLSGKLAGKMRKDRS